MLDLADGAVLLEMPNAAALDLAAALAERPPAGFLDAVPGARTLLVLFDPEVLAHETVGEALARLGAAAVPAPSRIVRLPTIYDGPDLPVLARESGLAVETLIGLHAGAEHSVLFLGFAPGFPYLSGAPAAFAVPRLSTPRLRVPAGSVAVADGYTGIYPAEGPGGWRLIGRVGARLFDPAASPPALLRPGDRVRFDPVTALEEPPPQPASSQREPIARVISPGLFTTVQGGPRYGLSGSGVPPGGAMDLPSLAAANALVGNAHSAAGLEILLAGPELELLSPLRFALGGAEIVATLDGRELRGTGPHQARAGERLRLGRIRRGARAYLCFEGGLAAPLPGEPARALAAGETISRASLPPGSARPPSRRWMDPPLEIRAIPGPQGEWFSARGRETFFSADYRVSPRSDRRGLRLEGPAVEPARPADVPPEGTAPGAVQVPGDGLPIVLGPDRPVTGGYAKIATVIGADLPLLAQARPGTTIRFRAATLAEALAARRGSR